MLKYLHYFRRRRLINQLLKGVQFINPRFRRRKIVNTPRKKCCEACAFRRGLGMLDNASRWDIVSQNPNFWQNEARLAAEAGEIPFYCVHAEDQHGNFHQCAGWYAKFGRLSRTAPTSVSKTGGT